MSSKNLSAAFSLMEVILALAIVALMVTPLLLQQSTIFDEVTRISHRLDYIYQAEQFWYETRTKMPIGATSFTLEKTLPDSTKMVFTRGKLEVKSAFAKQEHIVQDRVTISWQEFGQNRREQLVSYACIVKPKQEDK